MRRLIAALACRNNGSRLYGKPLQNLDIENQVSILDHIIDLIRTLPQIDEIVLGISEGSDNQCYFDYAERNGVKFITGDERDVLKRLIQCAEHVNGTDVFRITTESPFFYFELLGEAWKKHLTNVNDLTSFSGSPDGCAFELITVETLKTQHRLGDERHRSEFCTLYLREHREEFRVELLEIPANLVRYKDIRLTIDYPEDLIICRKIYGNLKEYAPRIPLEKIISFLDSRPDLKALVSPYLSPSMAY